MKTIKKNKNGISKLLITLLMPLLLVTVIGCSKDDDGSDSSIKVETSTVSIEDINTCSTSIGVGTIFSFNTPYTSSEGLKIEKMRIKTTVSDGDSDDTLNTIFTDTGSSIEWITCFTFGTQSWVEYEVRLESGEGSISNISKIKVNKPNGAN